MYKLYRENGFLETQGDLSQVLNFLKGLIIENGNVQFEQDINDKNITSVRIEGYFCDIKFKIIKE